MSNPNESNDEILNFDLTDSTDINTMENSAQMNKAPVTEASSTVLPEDVFANDFAGEPVQTQVPEQQTIGEPVQAQAPEQLTLNEPVQASVPEQVSLNETTSEPVAEQPIINKQPQPTLDFGADDLFSSPIEASAEPAPSISTEQVPEQATISEPIQTQTTEQISTSEPIQTQAPEQLTLNEPVQASVPEQVSLNETTSEPVAEQPIINEQPQPTLDFGADDLFSSPIEASAEPAQSQVPEQNTLVETTNKPIAEQPVINEQPQPTLDFGQLEEPPLFSPEPPIMEHSPEPEITQPNPSTMDIDMKPLFSDVPPATEESLTPAFLEPKLEETPVQPEQPQPQLDFSNVAPNSESNNAASPVEQQLNLAANQDPVVNSEVPLQQPSPPNPTALDQLDD